MKNLYEERETIFERVFEKNSINKINLKRMKKIKIELNEKDQDRVLEIGKPKKEEKKIKIKKETNINNIHVKKNMFIYVCENNTAKLVGPRKLNLLD